MKWMGIVKLDTYKKHIFWWLTACVLAAGMAMGSAKTTAQDLPGKGITVIPVKSTIDEETFQTVLVMRALEKLGYTVQPYRIAEYSIAYHSLATGDYTFMAASWKPLHDNFYNGAGGDAAFYREGVYSDGALQGYLIDKVTAEKYHITNLGQLKDPEVAKLFDRDGDGKADLTACTPGWGCQETIDHQMKAFGLEATVTAHKGSYPTMMADTIARYNQGKPILYYSWTPYWVSAVLVPGRDVLWIEVPFSSLPGDQAGVSTQLGNGKNYGFTVNTQHIVANKKFAQDNPAAAKLFSIMYIPVSDINAQNRRMRDGEDKAADIERHVDLWIKAHQETFDGWIEQALKAAR